MAKKKKWIQQAIKHPGALRATAKRLGYIQGDGKLTLSVLNKLAEHARKSGNRTLLRRVNLAKTLMKMHKGK